MNKKYTYVWISLIVLVFGIITIPKIVDRLSSGSVVQHDRMSSDKVAPLSYIVIDGKKAKVPNFSFINQDSVTVSQKDYLGKVYVVDFFFTQCPSICPVMTSNLVMLQNYFKDEEDFAVASFSIASEYDTPSVLKSYAKRKGILDADWNLLTGNQDAIHELANAGFNIFASEMEDAPGGFEHSGLFALVDKEGYLRSRTDAFGNPIVYYRGAITEEMRKNSHGEKEQISILKTDIKLLLQE